MSIILAALLLFLAACESDTAKLERLKTKVADECISVEIAQLDYTKRVTSAQRDRCDLATRDLNRFMR